MKKKRWTTGDQDFDNDPACWLQAMTPCSHCISYLCPTLWQPVYLDSSDDERAEIGKGIN